jgi:hypothetical protein
VKNDIAHIFFRFEKALSKEHGAFSDFIRALRDAVFVLDQNDLDQCLSVLREKHGMSDEEIEKKLKYDFAWFLGRVKRKVPTPPELEERYLAVYEVFKDVVCTKSGKKLFDTKHGRGAHLSCLKHIRRNCLSDIPFVSYYYPLGEDKDGLMLYRCIRGTSALEGLHQKLRQLVRCFSTSPRFMKSLVTVYLGRWNHRLEIEVRGMPKKYEGLYDGVLLDEEIEKMAAWNNQAEPPHSEWVSATTFQSTGEIFGLIDPVSTAEADAELGLEALVETEADAVADNLIELDTGVTEEHALLNNLTDSSRWLALNFGRWRPSGRVKSSEEWEYFKSNLPRFQSGAGNSDEADNHSSFQWSAYADDWNKMVASLGSNKPSFTYKTASLLQDAYKSWQKRARRDTTILPHTAIITDLQNRHTSSSSNQQFARQFVATEYPSRARPRVSTKESSVQTNLTGKGDDGDSDSESDTLESPAERARRLGNSKKRRRKNAAPRCRRCGKHWNIDPWKDLHKRQEIAIDPNDPRPQNKYLWHGVNNQVWDHCKVGTKDYEPGFPCMSGRMPRLK